MMSSMKLRKAKQKLENTEPFFYGLEEEIADILYHFPDMQHLYFDNRVEDEQETVKRKGFIVLTGDKGMAGAYNHNVIKAAQEQVEGLEQYHIYSVGEVGRHFFISQGYEIEKSFRFSANNPSIHRARVISEMIVDLYNKEQLDEVYVIYTRMINSVKSEVEIKQIMPLKTHEFMQKERLEQRKTRYSSTSSDGDDDWFMIYPSPTAVLEKLVYNYVTGFMYGALVESSASEENARMTAMQSAADNAEKILRELSIEYNRIRQAAITREVTEVISGAKALKKKKKKQAG